MSEDEYSRQYAHGFGIARPNLGGHARVNSWAHACAVQSALIVPDETRQVTNALEVQLGRGLFRTKAGNPTF